MNSNKRLRMDRSWLPQARGHAVKVIHLLLRDLLLDGSLHYRIIFMRRPIAEVLASQSAMLQRDGKRPGDPALLRKAFESQLELLDTWLASQPCIQVLPVAYQDAAHAPAAVATEVQKFLGLDLDVAAMAQAADPLLHRQRSTSL